MKVRPKIRNGALLGALAAVAASAWATNPSVVSSTAYGPDYTVAAELPVIPARDPVVVEEPLAPDEATEAVVATSNDTNDTARLVVDRSVEQPGIIVEDRRLTEDERIRADVIDRIAGNPRISGLIGVETQDSVVRLSGWTRTSGQAWHAERDARSVGGVRYVQNEIRPRTGGSV
jgi:hypothetical protein